jgi:hypothetical protein
MQRLDFQHGVGGHLAKLSPLDAQRANDMRLPIVDDAERYLAVETRKFGVKAFAPRDGGVKIHAVEKGRNHLRQPSRHNGGRAACSALDIRPQHSERAGQLTAIAISPVPCVLNEQPGLTGGVEAFKRFSGGLGGGRGLHGCLSLCTTENVRLAYTTGQQKMCGDGTFAADALLGLKLLGFSRWFRFYGLPR